MMNRASRLTPYASLVGACLAALAIALAWLHVLGVPDFPMDDAYIVQHVVDSLRLGHDTRYGGNPLNGATSLAHIFVVWLCAFVMPVAWAQFAVAAGSYILWVAGVVELARRQGASLLVQAGLALIGATTGWVLNQAFNGLETGMAMAAVTWTLVLSGAPQAQPSQGLLLGLLPWIRPELSVLTLLLLVGKLGTPWAGWSAVLARLRVLLPAMALVAVPIACFAWWGGGGVWPNTVSAKTYFFSEACWPLEARLQMVVSAVGAFLSSLAMGWAAFGVIGLPFARLRGVMAGFVGLFLLAYLVRLPGALQHNYFRYQYVLLPLVMTGWVALLISHRRWVRLPSLSALVVAGLLCVVQFGDGWALLNGSVAFTRTQLSGVSVWVERHVPEKAVVLVHDAGYISLRGSQHLVDLVGLKTPSSVDVQRQYTFSRCSRLSPAVSVIAARAGARYFVVLDDWDRAFHLTESLRAQGWAVRRVDRERVATAYKVYEIRPPPSFPGPGVWPAHGKIAN